MTYPDSIEQKLGFDVLRQKLMERCLSRAGQRQVEQIHFSTDYNQIVRWLTQVKEFKDSIDRCLEFPTRHFFDASSWLAKASIEGAFLEANEFLQFAQSLGSIAACTFFLTHHKDAFPELFKLTRSLTDTTVLQKEIISKIDDTGLVKENATLELHRIFKKLREEQNRLRKLSDQIYKHAIQEKWVPEGALPTIRDGRVVIPVLAEHKKRLRGFIADESATGQTVFIEPADMLDTNNEIRDLQHAQRREEIRILKTLTGLVREQLSTLEQAYYFQAQVDAIRAKALLAAELQAAMPLVENRPFVEWHQARHPLLYLAYKGKREIIPLSLKLDESCRMILVSGPNAGGKSVCLKTVGLLQYMLQCGLLIPLADHSRAGIFEDILLDIGDQQSIENDLSTYSSHLKNMYLFLQKASGKSLILLDELGSGTDPDFGGAISQAILSSLLNNHVWGVATTHYSNLKMFAEQRKDICNAAMRFDEQKMEPLFILDIGRPGSSFALQIAHKIGFPKEILGKVEILAGTELSGFEKLISALEEERQQQTKKIQELQKQEIKLKETLAKYQTLFTSLENRKKEIIENAKEEAKRLLQTTNREIEKTIRHIRENKAEKKETQKVRKSLQDLSHKITKQDIVKNEKKQEVLQIGDCVRIVGQTNSGVVLSIQDKHAIVQFGELKSKVSLIKIEKINKATSKEVASKNYQAGIDMHQKRASFNPTLDVRGKRVDELTPILESFMDSAILTGQADLKIIHGKGEGVLRKVIREQLKKYKEVASYQDEHADRGGDGITYIVLK